MSGKGRERKGSGGWMMEWELFASAFLPFQVWVGGSPRGPTSTCECVIEGRGKQAP